MLIKEINKNQLKHLAWPGLFPHKCKSTPITIGIKQFLYLRLLWGKVNPYVAWKCVLGHCPVEKHNCSLKYKPKGIKHCFGSQAVNNQFCSTGTPHFTPFPPCFFVDSHANITIFTFYASHRDPIVWNPMTRLMATPCVASPLLLSKAIFLFLCQSVFVYVQ